MVWSPESAANAYLDTVKLCKDVEDRRNEEPCFPKEPESMEFLSALAACMCAQRLVEISPHASKSTIALAAAARQTGGRVICILPRPESLAESMQVIDDSGLTDMVEFKVGDPYKLLLECENIDFSLMNCKSESYINLFKLLDMNPSKSVVVANDLASGKSIMGLSFQSLKEKSSLLSTKHHIAKGMEITTIGKSAEFRVKESKSFKKRAQWAARPRLHRKSIWVTKIDEVSGEEHLFKLPVTF